MFSLSWSLLSDADCPLSRHSRLSRSSRLSLDPSTRSLNLTQPAFSLSTRSIHPRHPKPPEVTWACRREYAATAVDVIARRTRLSFLNSEAALEALPTVIDIMSKELGWDRERQDKEFRDATKFLTSMGLSWKRLEGLTLQDVRDGRHRKVLAVDDDCGFPFLAWFSPTLGSFLASPPLTPLSPCRPRSHRLLSG